MYLQSKTGMQLKLNLERFFYQKEPDSDLTLHPCKAEVTQMKTRSKSGAVSVQKSQDKVAQVCSDVRALCFML